MTYIKVWGWVLDAGKRLWRVLRRYQERNVSSVLDVEGSNKEQDHGSSLCHERFDASASDPPERSEDATSRLSIPFSPYKVARVLALVAVSLALLSFISGLIWFAGMGPWILVLDIDTDLSLPSWYSALTLLLGSVLLATIAYAWSAEGSPRYARHWAILSAIFLFLCCDEMLRIHERIANVLIKPALDALGFVPSGILHYPWVLLYGPLVLVFVVAYFKFWVELPIRVKRLFFVAGALYVGGALGVELIGAWLDSEGTDFGVFVGEHAEELMEMLGAVVFAYALMSYLVSPLGVREIRLR
jgi:hypothetical protein